MAVLRLSGSAGPGASVNVAPGRRKVSVSWSCERGRAEGRGVHGALRAVARGARVPALARSLTLEGPLRGE